MRLLGARLDLADRRFTLLRDGLFEGDPPADAVAALLHERPAARALFDEALERGVKSASGLPRAMEALFAEVEDTPPWLDPDKLRVATDTMLRMGVTGTYALGGASLMSGYLSAGGVKPLAATGALTRMARRRLAETNKFVRDIMTSGGLSRFSDGYKTTLRVRLMHAVLRKRLAEAPDWRPGAWGMPINQHDMAGTQLQFSVVYIGGLAALGQLLSRDEREALMHLWRYVGALIGVRRELLPTSFAEGLELVWMYMLTEEGPDDDSRALASALVETFSGRLPRRVGRLTGRVEGQFLNGYSRFVLGREASDGLGLPDAAWKYAPLVIAPARVAVESLRRLVPGARERAVVRGRRVIEGEARENLAGEPAQFRV
jgi:ER-bound oxygenase mpaB/B'/Rubber oxygenase, catalytic domain